MLYYIIFCWLISFLFQKNSSLHNCIKLVTYFRHRFRAKETRRSQFFCVILSLHSVSHNSRVTNDRLRTLSLSAVHIAYARRYIRNDSTFGRQASRFAQESSMARHRPTPIRFFISVAQLLFSRTISISSHIHFYCNNWRTFDVGVMQRQRRCPRHFVRVFTNDSRCRSLSTASSRGSHGSSNACT